MCSNKTSLTPVQRHVTMCSNKISLTPVQRSVTRCRNKTSLTPVWRDVPMCRNKTSLLGQHHSTGRPCLSTGPAPIHGEALPVSARPAPIHREALPLEEQVKLLCTASLYTSTFSNIALVKAKHSGLLIKHNYLSISRYLSAANKNYVFELGQVH